MNKNVFVKFLIEFFIGILFVFFVTVTLLHAYGFRYDILERALVKRTIVDVNSRLNNVEIFFDDELVAQKAPKKILNVVPGEHKLRIEKQDFHAFERVFNAEIDIVSRFDDIVLFPKDINDFLMDDFSAEKIFVKGNRVFYFSGNVFGEFYTDDLETSVIYEFEEPIWQNLIDIQVFSNNFVLWMDKSEPVLVDEKKNLIVLQVPENLDRFISFNGMSFSYLYNGKLVNYDVFEKDNIPVGMLMNNGPVDKVFEREEMFYLLQNKVIYKYQHNGVDEKLDVIFDDFEVDDFSLWANPENDFLYLAVLSDEQGFLYELANGNLILLDSHYPVNLAFSPDAGTMLYSTESELYLYDFTENESYFLTRFSKSIENLSWYDDAHVFYVLNDASQVLCSLDLIYCALVWQRNENFTYIPVKDVFVSFGPDSLKLYKF